MKLLYLYIPSYGILEDAELNFCSDKRFHYNKENRKIEEIEASNPLSEDFFSLNDTNNAISSISALVGNNGAGKTSVAKIINHLGYSRDIEHILIWEIENELYISSFILPTILTKEDYQEYLNDKDDQQLKKYFSNCYECQETLYYLNRKSDYYYSLKNKLLSSYFCFINQKEFKPRDLDNFSFVYASNFYSPMHELQEMNHTRDISTSYLIHKDTKNFLNPHTGTDVKGDKIANHSSMDFIRNAKLIKDLEEMDIGDKLILPKPKGCNVTINSKEKETLRAILDLKKNKGKLGEIIKEVILLLEDAKQLDTNVLACFISNLMHYKISHILESENLTKVIYDKFTWFRSSIIERNGIVSYIDYDDFLRQMSFHEYKDSLYNPEGGMIVEEYKESIEMVSLLKIVREVSQNYNNGKNDNFYLRMGNTEQYDYFIKFIRLYFKTKTITDYLSIDWYPHISSGEYTQLNIYSRILSLLDYNDHLRYKNLLIFWDEIEITINPDIQVNLIRNLIYFMNAFFPKSKIHMIFATHSPILLSDIPQLCTVLLKKSMESNEVTIEPTSVYPQTFGANIHSLYKHSFFLSDGVMGGFASEKIKNLIKKVNALKPSDNESYKVKIKNEIEIIGEPFLRKKILEVYFEKTEPSEEDILQIQLKELEGEVSNLKEKIKKAKNNDSNKK